MQAAKGVRRYESPRERYGRGCILFCSGFPDAKAKSLGQQLQQKLNADDLMVYDKFSEEDFTGLLKDWYEKGIRVFFVSVAGKLPLQDLRDLLPRTLSTVRETALDIDFHFAAIKNNLM